MTRHPELPVPARKGDPEREERLAAALRANLKRRKVRAKVEDESRSGEDKA